VQTIAARREVVEAAGCVVIDAACKLPITTAAWPDEVLDLKLALAINW
jgi:hypothetical protein